MRKKSKWRAVFNERHSICETSIAKLDRGNWWWEPAGYIKVKRNEDGDEFIHRVYPRGIRGFECVRIGMRDGELCWIYDQA